MQADRGPVGPDLDRTGLERALAGHRGSLPQYHPGPFPPGARGLDGTPQGHGATPEWLDDNDRKDLLAKKPDREWSATLPATKDYQERVEQVCGGEGPQARFLLSCWPVPMPAFTRE